MRPDFAGSYGFQELALYFHSLPVKTSSLLVIFIKEIL
jgi:hypothetical protein